MADPLKDEDPRVARVCAFWQTLSPASLVELRTVYHEAVEFRDPFNDLHDVWQLEALLTRMFERLQAPRFVVREVALQNDGAVLVWDFSYRLHSWQPQRERHIHGASHVRFAADGRVKVHRDYWDAAEQVYEQLPVLGTLLRWLKHRLG
jgi:steroid Delta-isomerase